MPFLPLEPYLYSNMRKTFIISTFIISKSCVNLLRKNSSHECKSNHKIWTQLAMEKQEKAPFVSVSDKNELSL